MKYQKLLFLLIPLCCIFLWLLQVSFLYYGRNSAPSFDFAEFFRGTVLNTGAIWFLTAITFGFLSYLISYVHSEVQKSDNNQHRVLFAVFVLTIPILVNLSLEYFLKPYLNKNALGEFGIVGLFQLPRFWGDMFLAIWCLGIYFVRAKKLFGLPFKKPSENRQMTV